MAIQVFVLNGLHIKHDLVHRVLFHKLYIIDIFIKTQQTNWEYSLTGGHMIQYQKSPFHNNVQTMLRN